MRIGPGVQLMDVADVALNYKEQDFAAEVQNLTGGKGVDVIIENVAADNFAKDFTALGRHGRIVLIGTGTGKAPEATFMTGMALFKEVTIYGMALPNSVEHIPDIANALTPLFADEKIKAIVHKSYALVEAPQALQDLVAANVFGKLVLVP